jgi:hypothetical protein
MVSLFVCDPRVSRGEAKSRQIDKPFLANTCKGPQN